MIYSVLYDWQKLIVDSYCDRSAFGLFLDMGTGKTPISLAFCEKNKCDKILIITINSKATEDETVSGSFFSWARKMEKDYTFKSKSSTNFSENPEILLINYESLFKRGRSKDAKKKSKVELSDRIKEFILSCRHKNVGIIIDESHKIKNLSSLQTAAVKKIKLELTVVANSLYTYLLTGTPFTHGYEDLYAQLNLLGYNSTKTAFIDKFCERGNVRGLLGWQQPIVGYKNLDELFELVHNYAITIKSEEVCNLPEKVFVNHVDGQSQDFTMLTKENLYYSDIYKYSKKRNVILDDLDDPGKNKKLIPNPFYRNLDYPEYNYLCETVGSLWMRARQISIGFQGNSESCIWYNSKRLENLKKFLRENEDNYVLFYNYTPELLEIYKICDELGYNIDVYCGECKSLLFYEKYSNLSEGKRLVTKKNIIISNFASGSTGKNWQLYNQCIIFSVPVYKDWEQAIKRLHRDGQKNRVFYHFFYENNWLDNSMIESINTRVEYSEDLFKAKLKENC